MKTKRILSITIIVGFIIMMIVIQIDRKIHERDMYESEIKGILWKIVLKKGGHHYYYDKYNKREYFIDDDFFKIEVKKIQEYEILYINLPIVKRFIFIEK